ncbi:hypothetical protein NM688_g976 [Phlebia brevispora]|uniref:Uncharacterized protein n=1 Tax=Phlebia brevispora TaxID=194682 RepID=A0ACC1TD54_9APHY|nr:hypothetical protein NM688_g976 [Phlebia brevispora]
MPTKRPGPPFNPESPLGHTPDSPNPLGTLRPTSDSPDNIPASPAQDRLSTSMVVQGSPDSFHEPDNPFASSPIPPEVNYVPFEEPEIGLSLEEIRFNHSVAVVRQENREAPWYTPWLMGLELTMKKLHAQDHRILPLTMPQHPISRYDDTLIIPEAPSLTFSTESSPLARKARNTRFSSLSVEEIEEDMPDDLAAVASAGHDVSTVSADTADDQAVSSPEVTYALRPVRKPFDRTTRIPDFVQVMYWSHIVRGKHVWSRGRIVLIIEVKPTPPGVKLAQANKSIPTIESSLATVTGQTTQQAQHVFEGDADRRPDVLGILTCCGPFWYYREVTAQSLPRFPSLEERADPTFQSPAGTLSDGESAFTPTPPPPCGNCNLPSSKISPTIRLESIVFRARYC